MKRLIAEIGLCVIFFPCAAFAQNGGAIKVDEGESGGTSYGYSPSAPAQTSANAGRTSNESNWNKLLGSAYEWLDKNAPKCQAEDSGCQAKRIAFFRQAKSDLIAEYNKDGIDSIRLKFNMVLGHHCAIAGSITCNLIQALPSGDGEIAAAVQRAADTIGQLARNYPDTARPAEPLLETLAQLQAVVTLGGQALTEYNTSAVRNGAGFSMGLADGSTSRMGGENKNHKNWRSSNSQPVPPNADCGNASCNAARNPCVYR